MRNRGGAYGDGGMYPPLLPPRGSELDRGDGYGYHSGGGGGQGGNAAQGYGGRMEMGHAASGAGSGSWRVVFWHRGPAPWYLWRQTPEPFCLLPALPRTEVETAAETAVVPAEDLAATTARTTVGTGTWNGYEQRELPRPVVRLVLEAPNSTMRAPSSPLRPMSLVEIHSIASIGQRYCWKWCSWGTWWSPFGCGGLLGR
jgi:hypothetical protein